MDLMEALPVREHLTGEVAPLLARLAAEEASGVLSREGGALHLVRGRVAYAESVSAPGPDALLLAHGTLDGDVWKKTVSRRGAVQLLVDEGHLPRGAVELCLLGALFDAAYFALSPGDTPARFRYDDTQDEPGVVRPVEAGALERETARRRALLDRVWPDGRTDDAPLRLVDPHPPPRLPARRRAVLDQVDGDRTATDIAHRLGRRAFPTLLDVRRLAAAGLVTPLVTPNPPPAASTSPVPAPGPLPDDDPHITLLKRLRDALEAL
ncbi:transcriptional regulator [Streptomyces sp. NPDC004539]|uniref:transcriptional regulator n=1 Tax=Streptomyces sp. NPDC004539 TaxID=3154280 RepID=UPI0033A615FF